MASAFAGFAACTDGYSTGRGGGYPPTAPPPAPEAPRLNSVRLILPADTIEVDQLVIPTVQGFDQFGQPFTIGAATFHASIAEVAFVNISSGFVFGLAPGTVDVTATVNGVVGHALVTVVKPAVRINEIFTNGNIPGGFVELINPTDRDIDLGGFSVTTLDVLNQVTLPQGFIIPAHGYLTVNEQNFPRGLGPSDEVRLFSRFEALLDRFNFVGIPATDFSRCPELDGPFLASVPTRRAANDCENAQVIPRIR